MAMMLILTYDVTILTYDVTIYFRFNYVILEPKIVP